MDILGVAGLIGWLYGVSIIAAGVTAGLFTVYLVKEVVEQLEWSWLRFKSWLGIY